MEKENPKYLEEWMPIINRKLDTLLSLMGADNQEMTVSDIARMCKVSRDSLYRSKRYLLPDFGREKGRKRYPRKDVVEWLSRGEAQLRKEWLEMH